MLKNKLIKVLTVIVTPCIYSGGAENAAMELSKYLAKENNLKITIATMSYENGAVIEEKIVIKKFKSIIPLKIFRPYSNVLIMPDKLLQEIKKEKYDLIHIHNTHPVIAMALIAKQCIKEKIPYVVSTHGIVEASIIDKTYKNNILAKLFSKLFVDKSLKYVLSNADKIAALTEYEIPILEKYKAKKKDIQIVYNGVDLEICKKQKTLINIKEKYHIKNLEKIVLFVGVVKENKGIDVLIKSASSLTNCKIIIAGKLTQNNYCAYLFKLLKTMKLEDKIIFTGFINKDLLVSLYHQCDVFVLPTRADTLPLCILDAMICKKPVVSTLVGGIPEEVDSSNGILVEPNNPIKLAQAIQKLIDNGPLRKKMGDNGYKKAKEKFTWEEVARRVSGIYEEILFKK